MTSRCSGLGPPPPIAIVEASEARREEAIADPVQAVNDVAESNPKRCIIYMYIYIWHTGSLVEFLRCKELIRY